MSAGLFGLIDQPAQRKPRMTNRAHAASVVWCADNGCFSGSWDEAKWWRFLEAQAQHAATCLFAVAPDVVGDAAATLTRSEPWFDRIRALGYPVAFVAQDGQEDLPVPWDRFDVLFVGGTDEFKLGPAARRLVAEAKARGLWVHMGRVNSEKRWAYADAIGCDSVDGTYLTRGPAKNLPRLLTWVRRNGQPALFDRS